MAPVSKQASSRDLRHRVLTCLTRLSDRDTQALAVAELESIIPTLTADTPSVRAASLRLLSSISSAHRSNLSHHLPKLVSAASEIRTPPSAPPVSPPSPPSPPSSSFSASPEWTE